MGLIISSLDLGELKLRGLLSDLLSPFPQSTGVGNSHPLKVGREDTFPIGTVVCPVQASVI